MPFHKKSGVTLIEIIIGLALLSIISMFIYGLFSTQIRLFLTQVLRIDVSSQNKIALADITNQTRQAESIAATCPPCATDGTETADNDSVVYKLWGLDASGNPTSSISDYLVYKQVGTNLVRIIYPSISPASTRPASNDIIATNLATTPQPTSGLSFTYTNSPASNNNSVTVTVTTTKTESGKTQTISQSASAKIRNQPPDPADYHVGSRHSCNVDIFDKTIEVDLPNDTTNGNVMIMAISSTDNEIDGLGDPPIGWSMIQQKLTSSNLATVVYYKIANNEPQNIIVSGFPGSSSKMYCVAITSFRGIDTINPIDSSSVPRFNSNTSIVTANEVSTVATKTLVLFLASAEPYIVGDLENYSGTNPTTLAEIYQFDKPGDPSLTSGAAKGIKETAGSTGQVTADWDFPVTVNSHARLIALKVDPSF